MTHLKLRVIQVPGEPTVKVVQVYDGEVIGQVNLRASAVANYLTYFPDVVVEFHAGSDVCCARTENTPIGTLRRGGFSVI